MLFASDLENLIVLLAIMRARLQPRISYVRAEDIAMRVRFALMMPTFETVVPVCETATLVEACGIVTNECMEAMTAA
ncbi:hypothetical protein ABHV46_10935 [Asaia sp. BMEF1]|uniref:hypothetical protein n=1 Tax=Asaia sp. BMEF1 TaxID=3155932 RepID=UPI003F6752A5